MLEGISKLTTALISFTSNPRAATSVATRTANRPSRNSPRVESLWEYTVYYTVYTLHNTVYTLLYTVYTVYTEGTVQSKREL